MVTLIIILKFFFFWIKYYNLAQHALKMETARDAQSCEIHSLSSGHLLYLSDIFREYINLLETDNRVVQLGKKRRRLGKLQ